jgi:hypothetical protein
VSEAAIQHVREAALRSELAAAVASVRRDGGRALALGNVPLRPLTGSEISELTHQGNSSTDWSRVRVAEGFETRSVWQSHFQGDVWLGQFTQTVALASGVELPTGITRATLANCVIGHQALIREVKLLANYLVAEAAVLLDCGSITCEGSTAFGNGIRLQLGIERGGRDVVAYAEIDVAIASLVARTRSDHTLLDAYARAVANYRDQVQSSRGIIGRGALLRHTPRIANAYIGPYAQIDGATLVADSTLLSTAEEPVLIGSGACVLNGLLQWGSQVRTMAVVERSVLTEHAHVEQHGKVADSLLGPNTSVAKGEVTACLLGPFVGFHHQALLIATLWPEGKGNVGYGANVGSNHTSKAPDQEFWAGEGLFVGLGVNVKFPADLSRSPYSILASGITTLPQKVAFPFSLINSPLGPLPGIPPAYNEIIPAWLLTDNLYPLTRNEVKFRARNQARRHTLEFRVFRPEIVDLMRDARQRLGAAHPVHEVYTDRDINGLGKNVLLEKHRAPAIAAYSFFIRYYALLRLKEQVTTAVGDGRADTINGLLLTRSTDPVWEHARRILHEEEGLHDVVGALRQLPDILEEVARGVERSKAKDDERGRRIIDDYAAVHVAAADDALVRQTWEETRRLQAEVRELLAVLPLQPQQA